MGFSFLNSLFGCYRGNFAWDSYIIFFGPSIFLRQYHNHKSVLHIVSALFILLLVILSIFYVAKVFSCDFNIDYGCVARKALEVNDEKICEQVGEEFRAGLCYLHMSRGDWRDIKMCSKILDLRIQYECMVNIAINTNDQAVCESLTIDEFGYDWRESCFVRMESGLKYN